MTEIEPMGNGRQRIVVTELPYMVNKAKLIEKSQNWFAINEWMVSLI